MNTQVSIFCSHFPFSFLSFSLFLLLFFLSFLISLSQLSSLDQDKCDTFIETCDDDDESDECDALNDETFGDCLGDDDLNDWEKEHEKLAGMESIELGREDGLANVVDSFFDLQGQSKNSTNFIPKDPDNSKILDINFLSNLKGGLIPSCFNQVNQKSEKVESKLSALEFQEKLNLATYSPFFQSSPLPNALSQSNLCKVSQLRKFTWFCYN